MINSFPCSKCGICCRNLNGSQVYDDLHSGNGICRYLDLTTNLCKIYDTRPMKCNIIASYIYFKDSMSFNDYIEMNIYACKALKKG